MQTSTIAVSRSSVGSLPSEGRLLWNAFRGQVDRVSRLDVEPDNLRAYYQLVEAFRALRRHYVTPRKGRARKGVRDPSLERFADQRAKFRTKFYGVDEGHWENVPGNVRVWKSKRNWLGVAPEIRAVMEGYRRLRDAWHYHTPAGHRQRAKADRKYMRTPHGKARKAAYLSSEAGRATVRRGAKATKRKRQVVRGEAEQRLYDSWAIDEAIEGALNDV